MPLIDQLLLAMVNSESSDMHFLVNQPAKVRLNGEMVNVTDESLSNTQLETLLKEVCPEDKWTVFQKNKNIIFAYEIPGEMRFRCIYMYNYHGIAAVFRRIPLKPSTIEELNLPDSLRKIVDYQNGLICITGPSGCGKSTITAALIDYINEKYSRNIVTIENPIEFIHSNKKSVVMQLELERDINSFTNLLNSIITSDVDILYVADINDNDTVELALKCASIGVLVIINLCTLDSMKTIEYLINRFPEEKQPIIRAMMAESLRAIVTQTLCKKLDGERIAAHEILLWEDTIPNSIRNNQLNNIKSIIDSNRNMGMCLLDSNLSQLLNEGIISPKEAYMRGIDKKLFIKYIQDEE